MPLVGREIVEAGGGRVELLPMLGEVVTDAMVQRIARQVAGPLKRRKKK